MWAVLAISLAGAVAATSCPGFDPHDYKPESVIRRDVAVIGGGSSGTYTAVRLHDHGKSVVVVEKEAQLGGHAETYTAPNGYAINLGVVVFTQIQIVKDYFGRFNITLTGLPQEGSVPTFVDFAAGKKVDFAPPLPKAQSEALAKYREQLNKYPSLQHGFNMTYPVHPDLLLPFKDFVKKYSLDAMVFTTYLYNQGFAPILDLPMLYMFKYLNAGELDSLQGGFLTTKNHDTGALYRAAASFLGSSNVLLKSSPIKMSRSSGKDVCIVVQTPTGKKLIVAKKLVSAIPPTLDALSSYDLSTQEKTLFGQWTSDGYYTGILNNTGLNDTSMFINVQPNKPYGVPHLPGLYTVRGSPPTGLTQVYYGSPTVLSIEEVKADIEKSIARLQKDLGVRQAKPEWVLLKSHAPFNLGVSNEQIKDKFYEKLYALNGKQNTFYNGAAFHTQDSSVLWEFTEEYLLPIVLASLK